MNYWKKKESQQPLTQFLAIFTGNTTAVDDPDVVSDSRRNRLAEVCTNVHMCLLGLIGCCDLSSTNSPNWFISNHDFAE